MKSLRVLSSSIAVLTLGFAIAPISPADAADQAYDAASASDVWDLSTLNWDGGAAWINGDNAIFGGIGETLDVEAAIVVGNITFNSNGYTIADADNDGTLTLAGTPSAITVTNAGDSATISEILAGVGGLVKAGAGALTLSGANTWSGGLTVNAGALYGGNAAAYGAGAITLNGGTIGATGSALSFSNAIVASTGSVSSIVGNGQTTTLTGSLSGSGTVQTGNSAVNFQNGFNASRFTGALILGGSGPITLTTTATNQNSTLDLSKAVVNISGSGGFGYANGGSTANTGAIMLGALSGGSSANRFGPTGGSNKIASFLVGYLNTDTIFGGAFQPLGGTNSVVMLTKVGSGTLTLSGAAASNTMAGGVTIRDGALQLGDGGSSAGGFSSGGNALTFLGGGGKFNYVSSASGSSQGMAALTFSSGDATVQSTNNGSGSSSLTFSNVAARTAGATGNFVVSGGVNGSTNRIAFTQVGGAAPAAGAFIDKGYYFNGSDFAAWDLGGFVRALAYGSDANASAVDTVASGAHVKLTSTPSLQDSLSLLTLNLAGSGVSWTNNPLQTLTLSGGGLIKSGGGSAAAISGGAGLTTGGSAEFVIRTDAAGDSLEIQSVIPNSTTGGLTKAGAGTLTLSASGNAWSGATNLNQGTVNLTGSYSGNSAFTVRNAVLNVTGSLATTAAPGLTVGDRGGAATLNINGGTVIAGATGAAAGVRISNSATNNDSATAAVNVNAGGTLTALGDIAVGLGGTQTGRLVINSGGTVNVATTVERWLHIGQYDTVSGQVDLNSGGVLNLNTNGDIRFSANGGGGTNVFNQNGGNVVSYSNNGATLGGNTVLDLQYGSAPAANNTYNLNGGALAISQVTSTQANGTRTFNFNGGTLKVASNANAASFFNLNGGNARANVRDGGAIIDTNGINVTVAQALLHSNISGDAAIDGGLIKKGAGTLTLAGANAYTGATVVETGVLAVNGGVSGSVSILVKSGATLDVSGAAGGFTLAAGQTLSGAGAVTGAVAMSAGSRLAPGDGPGALTFANDLNLAAAVTTAAGAALQFELGSAASDRVQLTLGVLSIGVGALGFDDFTFVALGDFGSGTYTLFDTNAAISGGLDPDRLSGSFGGGLTGTLGFANGGQDIVLTVVPEPGAAALLLAGFGSMIGLRRFRRRTSPAASPATHR